MGLFTHLAAGLKSADALTTVPHFLMGAESKSGIPITWQRALQVSTMLAGARVLAEGVAQVPATIRKQRPDGGADLARDHWAWEVLCRKPNGWQTGFEFRETLMLHLVLCGNAFVFKNVVRGRVKELIPIEPGRITVRRQPDLTLLYDVRDDRGQTRTFDASLIWHLRGPSWNSWTGLDVTRLAREALGLALALEESHALMHKNGVQTSGFYSVEGNLAPEKLLEVAGWIKAVAGGQNKGAPLVLDQNAKWLNQSMTGVDSEHLATRKHQIEEVCRTLRIFPQMVGHAGDQTPTFASAEAFFTAHVVHSLQPWSTRIEESADINVIADPAYAVVLEMRGLMRGALKDQAEYFAKALGAGGGPAWMTQDEVRGEVDLNPMGGAAAQLREPSNVGKPAPAPAD